MKKSKHTTRAKPTPSTEGTGHATNPDGFEIVLKMPQGAFDRLAAEVAGPDRR